MDFHAHAKRNTHKSLIFVALIFALLGLLLYPLTFVLTGNPTTALVISAGIASIIIASLYFSAAKITLSLAKAQELDESHQVIHNIVEEMSLASGHPKPRVYMIDDPAPNAFAVGSRKEGHIVFTSGLLNILTREELQGVTAHEIAHLKNSDSRMMTIVAGVSVAIALLADFFGHIALYSGSDDDNHNPLAFIFIFVIGLVVSLVAPLLAVLIQSAVSREREWLADATAVDITRNPAGLRGALEKMQDVPTAPSTARSSNSHLWISEPLNAQDIQKKSHRARAGKKPRGSWRATHPPLEDRIERLLTQEQLYA